MPRPKKVDVLVRIDDLRMVRELIHRSSLIGSSEQALTEDAYLEMAAMILDRMLPIERVSKPKVKPGKAPAVTSSPA